MLIQMLDESLIINEGVEGSKLKINESTFNILNEISYSSIFGETLL